MKKRKKLQIEDVILDVVIYTILVLVLIATIYPMWYVIAASFTSSSELLRHPGLFFWPKKFTTGAYELVFTHKLLINAFGNTLKIISLSLPLNLVLTLLCGYFMTARRSMLKKPIIAMIMFTMFFSGGMIPSYLNVRSLGLYNTIWALVLPGAMSVYYAIICKTAIEAIPDSLRESAYVDGANDFHVLFKIITPLIKPTLAVLTLYYVVGDWNSWFGASIYMKEDTALPIQNILRSILMANQSLGDADAGDMYNAYAESLKYSAIVVSTVPILCIYPFLQKYFVKGVMIGAVKG